MSKVDVKVRVEIRSPHPQLIRAIKTNLEKAGLKNPIIEERCAQITYLDYLITIRPFTIVQAPP